MFCHKDYAGIYHVSCSDTARAGQIETVMILPLYDPPVVHYGSQRTRSIVGREDALAVV